MVNIIKEGLKHFSRSCVLWWIWRVHMQKQTNAKSKYFELAIPGYSPYKELHVSNILYQFNKPLWFYRWKCENFLMHFPINSKLRSHFSQIPKKRVIGFCIWTLHILLMISIQTVECPNTDPPERTLLQALGFDTSIVLHCSVWLLIARWLRTRDRRL
jgi:hypothetical protein